MNSDCATKIRKKVDNMHQSLSQFNFGGEMVNEKGTANCLTSQSLT